MHHALCAALDPVLERYAVHHSYACRPGKGNRAAVTAAQVMARRHPWFVKLDMRHFFETVDHARLLAALARRVKDRRVLELVALILSGGGDAGVGLPIGSLTSQHFGNFVLGALDHHALEVLRVPAWIRYMDDILVFGPDKESVRAAAAGTEVYVRDQLRQEIKTEATRLAPTHTGVPWLGFRLWPHEIRLDAARAARFCRRATALRSLALPAELRERSARGVFGWAEQASTFALRSRMLLAEPAEIG